MEDVEGDEIADESEDTGDQHVERLVNSLIVDHSLGCFDEQLASHHIDDGDVDEGSQRLSLFPPEGKVFGRIGSRAQPDCS